MLGYWHLLCLRCSNLQTKALGKQLQNSLGRQMKTVIDSLEPGNKLYSQAKLFDSLLSIPVPHAFSKFWGIGGT
jgi:hypothetical protein